MFDASAVLALLLGEPGCERLGKLQAGAMVSAVNVAEVVAKLVSRGMPAAEAWAAFAGLHLYVTPFDGAMAETSAQFVRKGVALGDRCFLATAEREGHGWTSDRELAVASGGAGGSITVFR